MNKVFLKIATLTAGVAMAIGVGAAVRKGTKALVADASSVLTYTLDGTKTGGSNGYDTDSSITQDGINWSVTGNTTMNPWRIGGKNLNSVSRLVKSEDQISTKDISKVVVEIGAKTLTAVNSFKLYVSSVSAGAKDKGEISKTLTPNTSFTFDRPGDVNWSNCYFTFDFNVTAGGSNSYVHFVSAKFYCEEESSVPDQVTVSGDSSTTVGNSITLTSEATNKGSSEGINQNVVWSSSNDKVAKVSSTGVVTGVSNGNATIRATAEDDDTIYGVKAISVTGGKEDDKGFVILPDDFPESYGDSGIVVGGTYLHRVQIMKNAGLIQIQKNTGLFENVAPFGSDISRIEIAFNSEKDQGTGYVVSVSDDGETFTPLSATTFDANKAVYATGDSGFTYFKLTAPTAGTLYLDSIFVGLSNTKEVNMIPLAKTLNDMLDDDCKGDSDTSNITSARWSEIEAAYVAGDADGKAGLAEVSGFSYFEVNKFIERYDYIVSTYSYSNFLSRSFDSIETKVANTNDNAAIIVIVVTSFSLLAASTWFILRKKKLSK